MWVLVLTNPAGKTRQIPFEGDQLVLGRSRSADVTVEDPRMSRMHLRFARGPKGSLTVEDLGAANGVFVQGQRIGTAPQAVAVGDQIQFGDCRVVVAAPVAAYAPGLSQTSIPSLSSVPGSGALVPWVLHTPADNQNHVIAGPTVVGRSLGADISLDHPSVSRRHAMLAPLPSGQLRIEDAGGTNGTFVNGERLENELMVRGPVSIIFGEFEGQLKPQRPSRRLPVRLPSFDRALAQKVLVAVLALVGIFLLIKDPPRAKRSAWQQRANEVDVAIEEAFKMIGEPTKPLGPGEKKVLDREKPQTWKGALDVVRERALMKDPLNQRARELERRLQLEIEANRDYTAGDKAMLKGDFDKALINFNAVPVGTLRYKEAVTKRSEAQTELLAQYQSRATLACRRARWRTCQSQACTYLAYAHSKAMVSLLAKAESRLSRKRGFERCSTLSSRSDDDPEVRKREEALASIYPDARLRQAMEHYASGRLANASRELNSVLDDTQRRSLLGPASSLRQKIRRVEGYVKRIREIERSGDLMMALRQWGLIRKVDDELLRGKLESKVIVDARSLLSQFVMTRAGERMGQKRYKEALSDLGTAQRVDPLNVAVTSALEKLTAEAPAQIAKEAMTLLANAREAAKGK